MTGQRRIIARILSESLDHPDIVELHRRVSTVDPQIGLSTVYRTVRLFGTLGIIERHDFGNGRVRIEQAPATHHDHLINVRSGKVVEFYSEEIIRLLTKIADRLGYRIVDHRLNIYVVPIDDD